MRIDFSEPECSNCFHCRLLKTQESEPSNVIASSEPVNSEPVQALEHASATVGSTSASTSSPVQALGHDSAPVGFTSTSSPIQSLGHESVAVGSISTSSPVEALGHDSVAVGSISTSSPVEALGHDDSAATGSISTFSLGSQTPSFQTTSGSGTSATSTSSITSLFQSSSPFGFAPAVTSVNSAPTTQAFGQTTSAFACSPNIFGFAPAVTSVSSAPTQASGFNLFAAPTQPTLWSMQAPVKASSGFGAFSDTTPPRLFGLGSTQAPVEATFGSGAASSFFLPFGSIPAPPTNTSSLFGPNSAWTTGGALPPEPGSDSLPAQDYPRIGVNRFANPFGQNIPIPPTESYPGFPGSKPNPFGQRQNTSGGGFSIFANPKTSPPQPFGFNAATTPLPSSSLSPPVPFSSNPNTGFNPFYAPTLDGDTGGMFVSVSASSHPYKSHEELRWEDYKKGNKGSRTNTVFGSPTIFASPSVPVHHQRPTFGTPQETLTGPAFSFSQHNPAFTGFGTQFPNSSVQRPHETAAVSSPASRCTACGATISTSASGNWTFNGTTLAPPSAATTSLPGMFYPMYGSVPLMFDTSPAARVTTPALQAYPFNGYILLPFAAMNLH